MNVLGSLNFLDRFSKRLEATGPKSFGWKASITGLACFVVATVYLLTKARTFSLTALPQDPLNRFQSLWIHYLSFPQAILGLGLTVFGAALALRMEWGRRGLWALFKLVLVLLFVLTPMIFYAFFLFFRDRWIPAWAKGGPGGTLFGYGTAILFGGWSGFVVVTMFWSMALIARRIDGPDYRSWTHSGTQKGP